MASPTVNQFWEMSTECSGLSWRICSLPFVRVWNISRPYTPQQVLGRGHEVGLHCSGGTGKNPDKKENNSRL